MALFSSQPTTNASRRLQAIVPPHFFRHKPEVEAWSRDHWYICFKPIREDLLNCESPPVDFHEIISLITPRAFPNLSGMNDGDPGTQPQRVLMLMKRMGTYKLEGVPENSSF
ncbi:MAG: hypothetical protein KJT03_15125 [Verrucomicrobiae bacterium]|nr:hypothetical protein [Verrucomicrobiae bacterium]